MNMPPTRFAELSPGLARAVIVVSAAIMAILVVFSLPLSDPQNPPTRKGDLSTYELVIDRLKAGEPYYQALHTELVDGGYGVRSVFNWRPPFFLSAVALAPSLLVVQGVLLFLVAVAGLMASRLVAGTPMALQISLAVLLVVFLFAAAAPGSELMCEFFAGALVTISVAAYGRRLTWLGFAAAVLALWTRELTAVYALICLLLALRDGRRREVWAWIASFTVFAFYYLWHASMVLQTIAPTDQGYADGWIQFGGIPFDLATAHFSGLFLLAPHWVTALMLPLAVLGLLAWPSWANERVLLTVLAYLAVFSVVGKPVNIYWGALYTPLLALGLVWTPLALRDLAVAARGLRAIPG